VQEQAASKQSVQLLSYRLDECSYDWLKVKNYQCEVVEISGIGKTLDLINVYLYKLNLIFTS
jgi:hypothetical protein